MSKRICKFFLFIHSLDLLSSFDEADKERSGTYFLAMLCYTMYVRVSFSIYEN